MLGSRHSVDLSRFRFFTFVFGFFRERLEMTPFPPPPPAANTCTSSGADCSCCSGDSGYAQYRGRELLPHARKQPFSVPCFFLLSSHALLLDAVLCLNYPALKRDF